MSLKSGSISKVVENKSVDLQVDNDSKQESNAELEHENTIAEAAAAAKDHPTAPMSPGKFSRGPAVAFGAPRRRNNGADDDAIESETPVAATQPSTPGDYDSATPSTPGTPATPRIRKRKATGMMEVIGMDDEAYEELGPEEYLDLSHRELGLEGVLDHIKEMQGDTIIKQLRLSYNIIAEEFQNPRRIEYFMRTLKKHLTKHETLTALDLAGNHLFRYHAHPTNEHVKNYQMELTRALKPSKITHLDVSDTNIAGDAGSELKGLVHLMTQCMVHRRAFKCRLNKLSSQGFLAVSNCLGASSSLTYLDLSYNLGGLDPVGRPNSEGTQALSLQLKQCLHLRVLKLAENHLTDDDMVNIADALHNMPQFQDLDVASNKIRTNGARALKLAIISHSLFDDHRFGFRHVDISNNPLGWTGIRELSEAVEKTYTMRSLRLRSCRINEAGISYLHKALAVNSSIVYLDIEGNDITADSAFTTLGEVQAACKIEALREDAHSVDAHSLTSYDYSALARKLRFLTQPQLQALHANASFNVPETEMQEALHLLEPPPRREIVHNVTDHDAKLQMRLQQSAAAEQKLMAARIIYENVLEWFEPYRQRFQVKRAMEIAKQRKAAANAHNDEDDKFGNQRLK